MDVCFPEAEAPMIATFSYQGHRRDEDLHGRAQGAIETALGTRDVGVGIVVTTWTKTVRKRTIFFGRFSEVTSWKVEIEASKMLGNMIVSLIMISVKFGWEHDYCWLVQKFQTTTWHNIHPHRKSWDILPYRCRIFFPSIVVWDDDWWVGWSYMTYMMSVKF